MNRLGDWLRGRREDDIRLVLVCGSRDWTDCEVVFAAISDLWDWQRENGWDDLTVLHGGARGADLLAKHCGEQLGISTREEKADWDSWDRVGPDPGRVRNHRMLAFGPDLVLAFKDDAHRWDGLGSRARGGTEHMCRIALAAKVPVLRYSHEHDWEELSA